MSGNVLEWIEDCWHLNYNGAPTDGSGWGEANGGNCGQRVMRGGSGGGRPLSLRSSHRYRGFADFRIFPLAFVLPRIFPNPLHFILLAHQKRSTSNTPD